MAKFGSNFSAERLVGSSSFTDKEKDKEKAQNKPFRSNMETQLEALVASKPLNLANILFKALPFTALPGSTSHEHDSDPVKISKETILFLSLVFISFMMILAFILSQCSLEEITVQFEHSATDLGIGPTSFTEDPMNQDVPISDVIMI